MKLTHKAIAEHLFLDRTTVSHFLKAEGLTAAAGLTEIRRRYILRIRGAARQHASASGTADLVAERCETEKVDRAIKTLEYQQRLGRLVEAATMEREMGLAVVAMKATLYALPDALVEKIAALHHIQIDSAIVVEELDKATGQLARYDPDRPPPPAEQSDG